jgi:hypothetical protein
MVMVIAAANFQLERNGALLRVHGGVCSPSPQKVLDRAGIVRDGRFGVFPQNGSGIGGAAKNGDREGHCGFNLTDGG